MTDSTQVFDPMRGIDMVPFPMPLVDAIDALILFARENGSGGSVQSERDWKTMEKIIEVWGTLYPDHAKIFIQDQKKKWSGLLNDYAASEEKGTTMRQHIEMPQKLHQMIKIIFPEQVWDKKFLMKFAYKLPIFRAYKKL